jgi:hypothetical protein
MKIPATGGFHQWSLNRSTPAARTNCGIQPGLERVPSRNYDN